MTRTSLFTLLGALLVLFLLQGSMYTVAENEQVVVTQFGRIVGESISKPGLHWKMPFTQEIHSFDRRWLEWDGAPNQIPTRDKKYIWIDAFARWRISDPIKFYKRFRDEPSAQSRLDDIIDGEVRNVIASHDLIEIVRSSSRVFERGDATDEIQDDAAVFIPKLGREKIAGLVLQKSALVMPDYGVELADIKVRRVSYVESVQEKVFERMISERKRIAERYRSEGGGKRAEIEGKVQRELLRVRSEAYEKAEEIRGRADAQAARIYADAYNTDAELYGFLKTLETYRGIVNENTDLVLSTSSPLLRYLKAER